MTKQTKKTPAKATASKAPAKAPKLTLKAITTIAQGLIKSQSRKVARKYLRDNGLSIKDIKVFN